jgi:hypothetical protein
MSTVRTALLVSAFATLVGCGSSGSADACDFTSTYDAIQETIFEVKGCTAGVCHGEGSDGEGLEGDLDLRAGASYDALVRIPSAIDPAIQRVLPDDQDLSLLYLKLAAATNDTDLSDLGAAMPVATEPLTPDELEAIRVWIRGGAPEEGIVDNTLELLGCGLSTRVNVGRIFDLGPWLSGFARRASR